MKSISLNDLEFARLQGLPHLQFRLYVVLRWYMDLATGLTGVRRGISRQSLSEELYVEPIPGRHASDAGAPSLKAVRSALDALERVGLIEARGNGEVLVFLLPLASRISARPNEEGPGKGRGWAGQEGPSESLAATAFRVDEGPGKGRGGSGQEGHTSYIRSKGTPSLRINAAAALRPVVDARETVLLHSDFAEWLRDEEKRRGKVARIAASDEIIAGWVRDGVTLDELGSAYDAAVADRDGQGNPAPINLAFLRIFVGRVIQRRSVCRGERVRRFPGWADSCEGVTARGRELGVEPLRPGEQYVEFRARVFEADATASAVGAG